jgi:hypothetical protein
MTRLTSSIVIVQSHNNPWIWITDCLKSISTLKFTESILFEYFIHVKCSKRVWILHWYHNCIKARLSYDMLPNYGPIVEGVISSLEFHSCKWIMKDYFLTKFSGSLITSPFHLQNNFIILYQFFFYNFVMTFANCNCN